VVHPGPSSGPVGYDDQHDTRWLDIEIGITVPESVKQGLSCYPVADSGRMSGYENLEKGPGLNSYLPETSILLVGSRELDGECVYTCMVAWRAYDLQSRIFDPRFPASPTCVVKQIYGTQLAQTKTNRTFWAGKK
jgi:hypothetical protein